MKKTAKKSSINKKRSENSFFYNVYEIVRLIPKGRVTSYRAIANYLGSAGSARMVGWAMNGSSAQKPPVPAHRVLNRIGMLTGKHHFGGPDVMQQLLESEGIKVEENKVIKFDKLFWDPAVELDIERSKSKKTAKRK